MTRTTTQRPAKGLLLAAAVLLALALAAANAVAAPIPFGERAVQLVAREQPLPAFVQDFFGRLDIPVSVSPAVRGAVNGQFGGPADRTWRGVVRAFNLVEYYDGAVLHVYAAGEIATRTLPVTPAVAERVRRTVADLQLADARNTLRSTREGTLIASGARRFIEQVEEIARAQAVGERTGTPAGFRVFYLRYAWAQDVTIAFGGRQVVLPGVASIVRALMTSHSKSRVSIASFEAPASNTVPGLRGPRSGAAQGTLGAGDSNGLQPSGPVVAALLAQNPPGPGAPGAAAPLPAALVPDAGIVRVEADPRLNAVVVRDVPDRLPQYEQLIAALDVEPQLLEIEATIIDLNTDRLRELGINWRATRARGSLLFGRGDESDLRLLPGTPSEQITPIGRGAFVSLVLGGANDFLARINALQEQGAAKVVSSPQVLTLSNVEATFDNSSTFFVRVAGRDDVDLFNVSAGTSLRVTPHVFKDNGQVRIKLLVAIEDGAIGERTVDTLPVVDRSAISTQALIAEGESLLVGGLVRESSGDSATKVPVLGDVPVLGALFRRTTQRTERVERLFLIQPRLPGARRAPGGAVLPAAPAPAAATSPGAAPAPAPPTPAAPAAPASAPEPPRSERRTHPVVTGPQAQWYP
jgi:type III secretion protein C